MLFDTFDKETDHQSGLKPDIRSDQQDHYDEFDFFHLNSFVPFVNTIYNQSINYSMVRIKIYWEFHNFFESPLHHFYHSLVHFIGISVLYTIKY